MSTNVETTLSSVSKKLPLMSGKYSFTNTVIILVFCSVAAALSVCILIQGAPVIDLSNLAPP